MSTLLERAKSSIVRWRNDANSFVREVLHQVPDEWQKDFLTAWSNHDIVRMRILLQACAGPGKTAGLAWGGLQFMLCHGRPGNHPKGAALSITRDNLRDNLWAEFAKWRNESELLKEVFGLNDDYLYANDHSDTWFLAARGFAKKANQEEHGNTLSGLHSDYVVILIDESGEIPISVMKKGEQAFTKCRFGRVAQSGNPTSLEGMLYAAAKIVPQDWYQIRITGDPDDPKRSPRIDIDWARKMIERWGRSDPWVMSAILGLFPPASINQLLGPDEVQAAMERVLKDEDFVLVQKRLGIDVARFGDDKTVIFPRQGLQAFRPAELRKADTNEIAARIQVAKHAFGSEAEYVDDTGGHAAGVVDAMIQANKPLIPVNVSKEAQDPRYFNKRSEIHFRMAEWVKRGGGLPNDLELKQELCALTYTFEKGALRVGEKDLIKQKIKRSPDKSDALSLTFVDPDMPASFGTMAAARLEPSPLRAQDQKRNPRNTGSDVITEYDPYGPGRW